MYVNFISFLVESLENDNISFFHFFLSAFLLMQVRMKVNVSDMNLGSDGDNLFNNASSSQFDHVRFPYCPLCVAEFHLGGLDSSTSPRKKVYSRV